MATKGCVPCYKANPTDTTCIACKVGCATCATALTCTKCDTDANRVTFAATATDCLYLF